MTSDISLGATTLDPWIQTIHFGGVFSNDTYTLSDLGHLFDSVDVPVGKKAIIFKKDTNRLNWPVPNTTNSLKLYAFDKEGSYLVSEPIDGNLLQLVVDLRSTLCNDSGKSAEVQGKNTTKLRKVLRQVFSQLSVGVSELRRGHLNTDGLSLKNVFYRYTQKNQIYIMIASHLYPDGDGTGETVTGFSNVMTSIFYAVKAKVNRDLPAFSHFISQFQPKGLLEVDALDVVEMHPFFWTPLKKVEFVCLFVNEMKVSCTAKDQMWQDLSKEITANSLMVIGRGWKTGMNKTLLQNGERLNSRNPNSPFDFLEVVRDSIRHRRELEDDQRNKLILEEDLQSATALLKYFEQRHPEFVTTLWEISITLALDAVERMFKFREKGGIRLHNQAQAVSCIDAAVSRNVKLV